MPCFVVNSGTAPVISASPSEWPQLELACFRIRPAFSQAADRKFLAVRRTIGRSGKSIDADWFAPGGVIIRGVAGCAAFFNNNPGMNREDPSLAYRPRGEEARRAGPRGEKVYVYVPDWPGQGDFH